MHTLSELIATLIGDAVDGVRAATTEAEARRQELREALDEDPTALVDQSTIDAVLRDRFPPLDHPPTGLLSGAVGQYRVESFRSNWQSSETAVRAGNLYLDPQRGDDHQGGEFPPIRRELGIELSENDLESRGGLRFLTPTAVDRVRTAIARRIGKRRLEAIQATSERGVPVPWVHTMEVEIPTAYDYEADTLTARPVATDDRVSVSEVGSLDVELDFGRG